MMSTIDTLKLALEALEQLRTPLRVNTSLDAYDVGRAIAALREALASEAKEQPAPVAEPRKQEPVSIKKAAQQAGINLPETYIPSMDEAIAIGDSVLMNEQAALLRECRAAFDSLIAQKPTLAGLLCGSTTLGNLKAELGAYRPQGVFGSRPQAREPLTDEEIGLMHNTHLRNGGTIQRFARAIEAAHGILGERK